MKYDEDKFLQEALDYIASTYNQHYVGKQEIQTIDVWDTLGSCTTTCRDTAIKYLMRWGKKDGMNKKDLLKAIHYIVLMKYFADKEQAEAYSTTKFENPNDRILLVEKERGK